MPASSGFEAASFVFATVATGGELALARRPERPSPPQEHLDRRALVGVELNVGGGNFKAQFRRADRSGAALALILGEEELARGVVGVKPLRDTSGQSECPIAQLAPGLDAALATARAAAAKP